MSRNEREIHPHALLPGLTRRVTLWSGRPASSSPEGVGLKRTGHPSDSGGLRSGSGSPIQTRWKHPTIDSGPGG
jgi:hypothetical protein